MKKHKSSGAGLTKVCRYCERFPVVIVSEDRIKLGVSTGVVRASQVVVAHVFLTTTILYCCNIRTATNKLSSVENTTIAVQALDPCQPKH